MVGLNFTFTQLTVLDVDLSSVESQTTIEARQDNPLGAEIQPVDTSVLGNEVKIDTVTHKKCSKK